MRLPPRTWASAWAAGSTHDAALLDLRPDAHGARRASRPPDRAAEGASLPSVVRLELLGALRLALWSRARSIHVTDVRPAPGWDVRSSRPSPGGLELVAGGASPRSVFRLELLGALRLALWSRARSTHVTGVRPVLDWAVHSSRPRLEAGLERAVPARRHQLAPLVELAAHGRPLGSCQTTCSWPSDSEHLASAGWTPRQSRSFERRSAVPRPVTTSSHVRREVAA